jgi:hypothetical protein
MRKSGINYSFVVVRPEQFVVSRTTPTNSGTLEQRPLFVVENSCTRQGTELSFPKGLGPTTPSHAFSDGGNIAAERWIGNRRYSLLKV